MPIRTSALRTLGAQGNVFAIESFLDELAAGRGEDPVAFRLRHLSDERAKDVIRSVAKRAKWKPDKQTGRGYGVGFARYKNRQGYAAVSVELTIDDATADARFGFFLEALQYGTPPHGGIAPGLDRITALLCGEEGIREVIAFPKTQQAQDLMAGTPSRVDPAQLTELGIAVLKPRADAAEGSPTKP